MRRHLVLFAFVLLAGCMKTDEMATALDRWAFEIMGGTFFGSPDTLSMKEIHLGGSNVVGREIIVEGKVADVSPNGTFVVLADESARLLVVLTDLAYAGPVLKREAPKTLRILGVVESGKKGLPLLRARSLNAVKAEAGGHAETRT
jgi:hypothetical protein